MSGPVVTVASLQPAVDVEQASEHLATLHAQSSGYVSLVLLGEQRHERHAFWPADQLPEAGDVGESTAGLQDVVNARWNVYVGCSTLRERPEKGRGGQRLVASVPGVWADLDVKPGVEGYPQSEGELCAWAATRLPAPTLEVATGSGGRHLYWLTTEVLEPRSGAALLAAWYALLRGEAYFNVDKVQDVSRVLRLAGTVRWPKAGERARPAQVGIVSRGPRYDARELGLLCQPAYEAYQLELDARREARQAATAARQRELSERGLDLTAAYPRWQGVFNATEDWGRLLPMAGWTLFADERDGPARCRYWTRPGKSVSDGKSACSDWVDADGHLNLNLTIYSRDPALEPLRENDPDDAVGRCSKYHLALHALFDDDEGALLRAIATGNGQLP